MKIFGIRGLSLKALARTAWRQIWDDAVVDRSASLAFWFLLGFFPMILFVISLINMGFHSQQSSGTLMRFMASVLPSQASSLVWSVVSQTTSGSAAWITLGFALWSSSTGTAGVIDGLNAVYDLREQRAWWHYRLVALALAVALGALISIALLIVTYGDTIVQQIAPGKWFVDAWNIAQWPAALALVGLALLFLYRYSPNVHEQKWKWLLPGTVVSVATWLGASFGFKFYVRHFNTFGITYGSLGTLVILMFWFYITALVMLLGGEINAIVEHAAAERGAEGAKRRGERRAGEFSRAAR